MAKVDDFFDKAYEFDAPQYYNFRKLVDSPADQAKWFDGRAGEAAGLCLGSIVMVSHSLGGGLADSGSKTFLCTCSGPCNSRPPLQEVQVPNVQQVCSIGAGGKLVLDFVPYGEPRILLATVACLYALVPLCRTPPLSQRSSPETS